MPRSRIFTPVVCLVAAAAVIASFFLASRGEAASGTSAPPAALDQAAKDKINEAYGKLPISFVANEGQADARVKFMSRGRGYSLYLTANEAVMVLTRAQAKSEDASKRPAAGAATSPRHLSAPKTRRVLRMELVGANSDPGVAGLEELPGKVNYLIGDESRWRTNLATFARVEYREVYPGINLVYYGNQRQLEYDFVLSPGARPETIRLQLAGSDNLKVNDRGDLLIEVAGDVVTMHKPYAYQVGADGQRREVQGRYVLKGNGQVAFEVKDYDKGKELVVDPVLAYSTEVGSGGNETAFGVAVDAAGSAYITGSSTSDFFPTTAGTLQPKDNDSIYSDAFVTKLNPAGTALVYSTYLGGGSWDTANGIDVDSSGNATITVARTGGTKGQLTVNYSTADRTAKAGSDYTAASGTLVFADGETTKTFTVAIANDNVAEPDETARLTLSGLPDVEMLGANSTAELKIQGNNTYVLVYGGNVTVAEGDSGTTDAVVTVNLSAASGRTTVVNYSTGGYGIGQYKAEPGTDYQPVSGTLVFGPGVTSQTVHVPIIGDTVDEPDESFTFSIQTTTASTGIAEHIYVVIDDDEADPEITIDDARVAEGHSGQKTLVFPLRLSRASASAVTVGYNIGGGTAQAFRDYYYSAPGNVTFGPGTTSTSISVTVNGDTGDEPDETFLVSLYESQNAKIADGLAVGTIADDDPTAITISDVVITEGNSGAANAVFKVSLSGPNAQTVTVNYTTGNGTAVQPSDYTAKSGTLSFAPGQVSQNVVVPVTGDLTDEPNETFKVQLLSPTNAVIADSLGNCIIADNDAPPTVSVGNVTVTEANTGAPNATLTLTLSAVSGHDVSVNYSTQNGTALMYSDYYPASGFVIFSPGQKTRTVTVPVVGDTVDEPNENFKVVLSNPYNATLGTGTGVCTITDNDAPPTVSVGDVVVTEGDTTAVNATFAVSLSAASGHSVTVKYATADGTALAASDYTALSLRTMTFAPGETGQTVTVPVRGDTLDEANENFKLVLSAPVNATLADSQGVCTITDNEPAAAKSDAAKTTADATPTIGFAESVYSVGEGDGRLEVTVRRGGDLSGPLAVEYATADATAHDRSDYGAAIGRLRFASGEESKSFVVFITDDAYAEGEESLQLSLSVIEDGAARGSQSTAEVRVADNDNAEGAVNPLDDASFFVRQQFVDIMGREPEPEESAALVKKLNECQAGDISCGREAVSAGLLLSEEHLSRVRLIHGLYRATLGRAPQYRELVRELHELSAGEQSGAELTDDEKKARVRDYAAEWLAVAERGTKKTDRQFVNTLVGNSGLKTAAASELLGGLSRKEKTRAEVLLDVLGNTEVKDRWRNEALVAAHYFTYLRREPDEDGLKFWLEEAQKAGATLPLGVVSGFVNSAEYRQRFGRP